LQDGSKNRKSRFCAPYVSADKELKCNATVGFRQINGSSF